MVDLSRDITAIYASKIYALAAEMEANNFGRGEGEIVGLLRAVALDLDVQNARGGTAAAMVRPEALAPFTVAAVDPCAGLTAAQRRTISMAANAVGGNGIALREQLRAPAPIAAAGEIRGSDPVLNILRGDTKGTASLQAAANVIGEHLDSVKAASAEEAEKLKPAVAHLFALAQVRMPVVGTKLTTDEVSSLLDKARIQEPEARISRKRMLERAGWY